MASQGEDDLVASKTEGYKPGEKKTMDEYAKLGGWGPLLVLVSIEELLEIIECQHSTCTRGPKHQLCIERMPCSSRTGILENHPITSS